MMLIFSSADLLLPNGSPGSIPGRLRRSFEQNHNPSTASAVLLLIRCEPTTRQTVEPLHCCSTLPPMASGIRNNHKLTGTNRTNSDIVLQVLSEDTPGVVSLAVRCISVSKTIHGGIFRMHIGYAKNFSRAHNPLITYWLCLSL